MPLTPEANLFYLLVADETDIWRINAIATYSTSSSAWTLFMPWTRAIPSLISSQSMLSIGVVNNYIIFPYPTERTRPVSARPDSSWTPRMRCSRMEVTSVGVALASAA